MKRIFLFSGGGFVAATTPDDFVTKMHGSSLFGRCDTDQQFMDTVARRCELFNGALIDTDTPAAFLRTLVQHDFVFVIDPH